MKALASGVLCHSYNTCIFVFYFEVKARLYLQYHLSIYCMQHFFVTVRWTVCLIPLLLPQSPSATVSIKVVLCLSSTFLVYYLAWKVYFAPPTSWTGYSPSYFWKSIFTFWHNFLITIYSHLCLDTSLLLSTLNQWLFSLAELLCSSYYCYCHPHKHFFFADKYIQVLVLLLVKGNKVPSALRVRLSINKQHKRACHKFVTAVFN